ncbi:hypothetical protein Tco_0267401 [Tanacetum coccineum]
MRTSEGVFRVFFNKFGDFMEEIEATNKAAVESFHRILYLLAQPKDHVQSMNLIVQTSEAVIKFKKVVSLLDDGLSHSRVRIFKKKSFMSSYGSSFHLIGSTRSTDQGTQQHKLRSSARGEERSVKCGSSGRCHNKKRYNDDQERIMVCGNANNRRSRSTPDLKETRLNRSCSELSARVVVYFCPYLRMMQWSGT